MNLKVEPLFQLLLSAFHRDPRVVEAVAVGNLFTNLNNYEGCCIVVVEDNFGGSVNLIETSILLLASNATWFPWLTLQSIIV